MNSSFLFVEVAAAVFFVLGVLETRKHGLPRVVEFLMIFFYALILEELDMRIFKSYHYGAGFMWTIGQVPVCIALLWAVILAGAMAISDAAGVPETAKPFVDGLLAVWLDLSLDAVAIRMGYWTWSIPMNQGWFGVPAGNLYAWIWVAFLFSVLARIVRQLMSRDKRWIWAYAAVPPLAYLGLFLQLNFLGWFAGAVGLGSQQGRLVIFAAQFFVFLFITVFHWKSSRPVRVPSFLWTGSRYFMHIYFLVCFFIYKIYVDVPALGLVALAVLVGEFWILRDFKRKLAVA